MLVTFILLLLLDRCTLAFIAFFTAMISVHLAAPKRPVKYFSLCGEFGTPTSVDCAEESFDGSSSYLEPNVGQYKAVQGLCYCYVSYTCHNAL